MYELKVGLRNLWEVSEVGDGNIHKLRFLPPTFRRTPDTEALKLRSVKRYIAL